MRNSKPILLVEDDRIDALTVKRALKDLKVINELVHVVNGEEALDYLRNESNKKPCVILLDLNLPKLNGLEFLKIAKGEEEEELKKIPVVALTTSKEAPDIDAGFELGVAGYIVKPVNYEKFVEAIRVLELYWTLSELPNGE